MTTIWKWLTLNCINLDRHHVQGFEVDIYVILKSIVPRGSEVTSRFDIKLPPLL